MSAPTPNGDPPEPTAAPSPPDEPPAARVMSYGFELRPYSRLTDSIQRVSSDVFVTPSGIAPASANRCTAGALSRAWYSLRATTPADCGMPARAIDSLTVNGTPRSTGNSSG